MLARPFALVLLVFSLSCGAVERCASRAGNDAAEIPFVFDDARVWVEVCVGNTSSPHWFILDSGAATSGLACGR